MVFAHGAGTDRSHPLVAGTAERIAASGIVVVTFDFPYRAEGRRWPPDRMPVLCACMEAVAAWARLAVPGRPFVGGRSLGGRAATVSVADGLEASGVICHAYPLHPRARPERVRAAHLPRVAVPMLFVRGTRDEMATDGPFDRAVRSLPGVDVVDLDGFDHSFAARRGAEGDPVERAATATAEWIRAHSDG